MMAEAEDQPQSRSPLTPSEIQVLQAAADGQASEAIALIQARPVSAIALAFEHIYIKLDAVDRAHAVAQGFRASLLR